jgi:GAF domain-containing protein
MSSELELAELIDPAFLASTVQQAALLLRASGGGYYLCGQESFQLTLVAEHGLAGAAFEIALLQRICQSRVPVIESNPGQPGVLAVPSVWQDSVRGVLVVVDEDTDRHFGQEDAERLQPMANLAAAVLHQSTQKAKNWC